MKSHLLGALCTYTLFFSTGVGAAMVNISFSGDITSISDPAGELASNGFDTGVTTFSGLISYDSTLTPSSTGGAGGGGARAFYTPTTAFVTIDGFDFSVGQTLIIDDFDPGTGTDKLWKATAGVAAVADCIGTFVSCFFDISFWDSTGTVFSDTSLPTSLDLDDFDTLTISVSTTGATAYQIDGNITSAAVSTIPIPAAAWLFGSGLLGLAGIARRRKAA